VLFLVVLFFIKKAPIFKNTTTYQKENTSKLAYGDATIEDLVSKDGDGDGILDWEEGLWGTDPKNRETNPGTPDSVTIAGIKAEQKTIEDNSYQEPEKLTETDKFSREFFATIATLNQNGAMDQETVEALSASLAEKLQNSEIKKVYLISEIKVISNDSLEAILSYKNTLNGIVDKYKVNYTVLDVLQKFSKDEDNIDASVLSQLTPIIENTDKMIGEMVKMAVPKSLSVLHLNVVNSLQRLVENLKDIQLYDADAIVFYSAVSQYFPNANTLDTSVGALEKTINQKFSN